MSVRWSEEEGIGILSASGGEGCPKPREYGNFGFGTACPTLGAKTASAGTVLFVADTLESLAYGSKRCRSLGRRHSCRRWNTAADDGFHQLQRPRCGIISQNSIIAYAKRACIVRVNNGIMRNHKGKKWVIEV